VSGDARDSVRQSARPVIELDFGILVYPPETDGEPWRAVFTENGQRKYRQGATEAKLAEKPGSSAPSRRNSMTDTDLHQPDPGPLRAASEAAELAQAASGLVSIDHPTGAGGH
jgi:hypothetical protein